MTPPEVSSQDLAEPRTLAVQSLGSLRYAEALDLQNRLVGMRRNGEIEDTLLLLEHPHVLTLGTSADPDHVLVSPTERELRGIELFESGRGGDVTYHGPGQLVGYPILNLKPDRCDLHRYLRDLEQVLIDVLTDLRLEARREPGLTGVWVRDRKLAAIGVRVSSGWITSHGFALNVTTDLSFFETIVPCGISDRAVGSIAGELGGSVDLSEVEELVAHHFCSRFGYERSR